MINTNVPYGAVPFLLCCKPFRFKTALGCVPDVEMEEMEQLHYELCLK